MIEFLQEGSGVITPPLCTCWDYIHDEAYYMTRPGFRAELLRAIRAVAGRHPELRGLRLVLSR